MTPQLVPSPHFQVFTCAKCKALCLPEDLSKTGKCKACSRNKMNAQRTQVGTIWFASKHEANRYQQLLWLQKAHKIGPILLQPPFLITINGVFVCTYYADFSYTNLETGEEVVEDAKGYKKNPTYRLKKKLTEALYNVKVIEV